MLAGVPFDLLVNLTDMQEHEQLNRQALGAGKHIWSEKPIANSLVAGQELLAFSRQRGLRLWGAPTVVRSGGGDRQDGGDLWGRTTTGGTDRAA